MMVIMDTGGCLLLDDTFQDTVRRWKENGEYVVKKFKYKLLFDCHFHFFHAVDNHNNLSHALTSIEDTCMTTRWECWVFDFILDIS